MSELLPEMLTGKELAAAIGYYPDYDPNVRYESVGRRLEELSKLYDVYVPGRISSEIYTKLYLSLKRSLDKKQSKLAVLQRNANRKAIKGYSSGGIIGGSDSFTIIGPSGIGKSTAIHRAMSLLSKDSYWEIQHPYAKIVPCLVVQCPQDSPIKGLLYEILRKVDEVLGSRYYQDALRARSTADMLIGAVSQVALNHVGLLMVDEIDNVVYNKTGRGLIATLTQLINNSGVSIGLVGTPDCIPFFESAMQLARRSVGLQFSGMDFDKDFRDFCKAVFGYQFVRHEAVFNEGIANWLYGHSSGIASIVVSLLHDAQELAITGGSERLDIPALNEAFSRRMSLVRGYVETPVRKPTQSRKREKVTPRQGAKTEAKQDAESETDSRPSLEALAGLAASQELDAAKIIGEYYPVTEVAP